jgi:hypothetical protein
MAQESKIEVINRFGWRKDFVVNKPIVQIGSDSRNDIVLADGIDTSIAARHAQLVPSAVNRQGMRLVNLSEREIMLGPPGGPGAAVPPRGSAEINSGDQLRMGEFTLIFQGGEQRSVVLRLSVEMSGRELAIDRPISGMLTIHHLGNQAAVQFKIEVEGMDPDQYEIGPGPVLFPNAEKQVGFRIHHPKKPSPAAGDQRITFRVTAPDAYPGESASISQDIQIAPFYRHRMRVVVIDSPDYRLG